ncbi:hypothetical protein D3C87_2016040 [compost metagenome]
MRAASISSFGNSLKKLWNSSTEKETLKATCTVMMPQWLSSMPRSRILMKSGRMPVAEGNSRPSIK